jgi:hypothetical protein
MGSLWTEAGARAGRTVRRCPGVRPYGGGMTMSSAPEPVPIRVLLPGDQEVVAHLWSRRQAPDGWRYEVGLPAYRNGPNGRDRGPFCVVSIEGEDSTAGVGTSGCHIVIFEVTFGTSARNRRHALLRFLSRKASLQGEGHHAERKRGQPSS